MKKVLSFVLAAVFALTFFAFAFADVTTSFYGYQWLRYDYQVYGGSYGPATDAGGNDSDNTFSIPRTYLRWKMSDPTAGYEGNLTLDINNTDSGENSGKNWSKDLPGAITTGSIDWAIWVKNAYVDFTNIPLLSNIDALVRVGQQNVYFGTIDTWTYPTIEKSIEDKNGVISSADQGISLVGKIGGWGGYEAAVYNGTGYKTIADDSNQDITDKAYDLSVLLTPFAGIYARASYYHRLTNPLGTKTYDYNASAVVVGAASGPIDAFVEYLTANDASKYAAGASGVLVGWESYLGIKLTNILQLHARIDTYDPDTRIHNNEVNTYIAGVNIDMTNATTLQLDYQLDANKYPFLGGAKDNNNSNNNQFLAQLVWKW